MPALITATMATGSPTQSFIVTDIVSILHSVALCSTVREIDDGKKKKKKSVTVSCMGVGYWLP